MGSTSRRCEARTRSWRWLSRRWWTTTSRARIPRPEPALESSSRFCRAWLYSRRRPFRGDAMRKSAILVTSFLAVLIVSAATPTAQTKPTLTPADYDQFESVSPGAPRGGLSPNGKWLAYNINRIGGENELRIIPATGATASEPPRVVAFGTGAAFTSKSEWLAYGIAQSEAEQERLR